MLPQGEVLAKHKCRIIAEMNRGLLSWVKLYPVILFTQIDHAQHDLSLFWQDLKY